MDTALVNQVVIVTGASGGIGDAICREFLSEGSIVLAVYRGNIEKLKKLNDWLNENESFKSSFHPIQMDISTKDSVNKGISDILREFGKIDVLVNCVGLSFERPFLLTEEEDWDNIIDINLSSSVRLCRVVLKPMFKQKRGAIVNVSSVLSSRSGRGNVAYATAKAGLNRFTQALATEVGLKGIRVNAVCPGVIDTKMSDALNLRFGERIIEMTPLGRNGTPEEVAMAVVFMASSKTASFITGTTLYVDGGISI